MNYKDKLTLFPWTNQHFSVEKIIIYDGLQGGEKSTLDLCVHFKRAITKVFSKIISLLDSG